MRTPTEVRLVEVDLPAVIEIAGLGVIAQARRPIGRIRLRPHQRAQRLAAKRLRRQARQVVGRITQRSKLQHAPALHASANLIGILTGALAEILEREPLTSIRREALTHLIGCELVIERVPEPLKRTFGAIDLRDQLLNAVRRSHQP